MIRHVPELGALLFITLIYLPVLLEKASKAEIITATVAATLWILLSISALRAYRRSKEETNGPE